MLKKLIGTYQNMIVENEFIKETNAKMKDVCGIAKKVCRTMFSTIVLYHVPVNKEKVHTDSDFNKVVLCYTQ